MAWRALALVREHAFDGMGLERLGANVFDGNDASRRILERGGFVHEGILRGVPHHDGRVLDHHQYGITRSGWAGSRRA